jgi:TPP-dependent pyruvate/acetoin dehydrogenase alpha subunit
MIKEGIWSEAEELTLNEQLDIDIAQAWGQAVGDPYPDSDSTLKYVYSSNRIKD